MPQLGLEIMCSRLVFLPIEQCVHVCLHMPKWELPLPYPSPPPPPLPPSLPLSLLLIRHDWRGTGHHSHKRHNRCYTHLWIRLCGWTLSSPQRDLLLYSIYQQWSNHFYITNHNYSDRRRSVVYSNTRSQRLSRFLTSYRLVHMCHHSMCKVLEYAKYAVITCTMFIVGYLQTCILYRWCK